MHQVVHHCQKIGFRDKNKMSSLLVNLLISSFLVGLLAAQRPSDGVSQRCSHGLPSCSTYRNARNGALCNSNQQPDTGRLGSIAREVSQSSSRNQTLQSRLSSGLEITSHPDCPLSCFNLGWPTPCGGYMWYYYNGKWWLIWHIPGFPINRYCWCPRHSCRPRHPFGLHRGRCIARRPTVQWVIVIDLATGQWRLVPISLTIGCDCSR
ncbi:uncharacterized protein [Watersipora subatra]|uniref:uncharacterized protein isoform X2 n=1 Tax=Watersipora subatra TaxID=2589382 RepID=UPI00355B5BC3